MSLQQFTYHDLLSKQQAKRFVFDLVFDTATKAQLVATINIIITFYLPKYTGDSNEILHEEFIHYNRCGLMLFVVIRESNYTWITSHYSYLP